MAKKRHPYIQAGVLSAMIFAVLIFLIVLIALYVHSSVSEPQLTAEETEKNLTAPGKLYPRQ